VSVRVQSLLIIVVALCSATFLFMLLTANTIDDVQNRQIREIQRLAQEQMNILISELREELDREKVDLASDEGRRLFGQIGTKMMKANQDVLRIELTDVLNTSGTLIITNDRGEVQWGQTNTSNLDNALRMFQLPLNLQGRREAMLGVDLNYQRIVERAKSASELVRRSLLSLAIVMMTTLLVTSWLLLRVFRRHARLIERNARLNQMAYVGTLAAGLAHEIRNPLHAMSINLQVLDEEVVDPRPESADTVVSLTTRLKGQVQELNRSVTRFLEYARPERHAPEPVDVRAMLRELCQAAKVGLDRVNGQLQFIQDPALGEELPEVPGRSMSASGLATRPVLAIVQLGALRQALLNILTNAVQAMEARAQSPDAPSGYQPLLSLSMSLTPDQGALIIRIADNGIGIPVENRPRVFDVFFSTKPGGSGFGLAIAKRVIEDHKGSIMVESAPGQGTSFTIVLPRGVTV